MFMKKDLRFFIDLARNLSKVDNLKFNYEKLLDGIVSNPNITKEQFLDVYLNILPNTKYEYHKYCLFEYFAKNHPQKENLRWIWGIAKDFDLSESEKPLSSVGQVILRQLDKNDELWQEVVKYFASLKGRSMYNKIQKQEWSIFAYYEPLKIQIEIEKDMDKYDDYTALYEKYRIIWDGETDPWSLYEQLSSNPYIDDKRIRIIFNAVKKFKEEDNKVRVLKKLISRPKISEKLFGEILEYRRKIKFVTLWNNMYAGAAENPTHIGGMFRFFYNYLKTPISFASDRYMVFCFLFSNPSLADEQTDKLIDLLQKHTAENKISIGNSVQMFDIFASIFKRKNFGGYMAQTVLTIFFNYTDQFNSGSAGFIDDAITWLNRKFDLSSMNMGEKTYNLFIKRASGNVFKFSLLSQLLLNKDLTKKQYEEIAVLLESAYFRENKLQLPKILGSHETDIAYILYNWASCKYTV